MLSLALLMVLPLSGCQLSYVFHAATGQIRFLYHAVPTEEALAQESLSPDEKRRLSLVSRIKAFGEDELGLRKSDNYQTVNLRDRTSVYTVSACPKDKLTPVTWWFPVVGRVPYLGFFDIERAKQERQRLLDKDLDVFIGRAEAYSTLGWFKDPLPLSLLQGSDLNLIETILHEMTHATLYIKGQGEFNEGLAQLIGKRGAFLFLEQAFGPSHPWTLEARDRIADERVFCTFLNSLVKDLDALYKDPDLSYRWKVARREEIFDRHLKAFEKIREQMRTRGFAAFGQIKLNNAFLTSVLLYHRHYDLFETVLARKRNSIKDLLAFFRNLSGEEGNVLEKTLDWVNRQGARTVG